MSFGLRHNAESASKYITESMYTAALAARERKPDPTYELTAKNASQTYLPQATVEASGKRLTGMVSSAIPQMK